MAMSPKKIYRGVPAAGAPVTVYTVTTGTDGVTATGGVLLKSIVVSNTTSSNAVVSITAGGIVLAVSQFVSANSVLTIESGILDVLVVGDTLQIGQGTASALAVRVMGVTY